MNPLYNSDIKEQFLATHQGNTSNTYRRIFIKSYEMESILNKDLFDFEIDEIEKFLLTLKPLTIASSKHNANVISSYIKWANVIGLAEKNADMMNGKDTQWFVQFVDMVRSAFSSEEEISNIEKECINAQDSVIVRLLFQGVEGESCSEIINLKKKDVDYETGIVTLTNKAGLSRQLHVNEYVLSLLKKASQEKQYTKRNGVSQLADNIRNYTDLVDNEYIIRASNTGKNPNADTPVNIYVIYRRLQMLGEVLEKSDFNVSHIRRSGMLKYGKDMLIRDGQLENDQYKELAIKYNVDSWWGLKDWITIEHIRRIYPDVEITK